MKKYLFLFGFVLTAFSCMSTRPELKIPFVSNGEIVLDARAADWKGAPLIDGLVCPWEENLSDRTRFYAAHDEVNFYFYFETEDATLTAVCCAEEDSVMPVDRVELFMSCDEKMKQYYGAEIDPTGKTLDYSAQFYRKSDFNWDFSTLRVVTSIDCDRYIVEGAISKKELKALGLLKENGEMLAGVFRGDAQSVGGFIYWYPWIDPHVDEPDFHIPATLGRFVFLPE